MTHTALCERFISKSDKMPVFELNADGTIETLVSEEQVWHLEFSKWALYSVRYIDMAYCFAKVYVTPPNDGYKKADF